MSSLINILLNNSNLLSQNTSQKEGQTTESHSVSTQPLHESKNLIYTLIEKEKYELLQTILVGLKKEEQQYVQKVGRQGESSTTKTTIIKFIRPNVMYGELLNVVSLSEFVCRVGKLVESEEQQSCYLNQDQKQEEWQLRGMINLLLKEDQHKIVRIVEFFVNFVFTSRRINAKQTHIIRLMIESLRLEKVETNNQTQQQSDRLQKVIQKWEMVLNLAQQSLVVLKINQTQLISNQLKGIKQQLKQNKEQKVQNQYNSKWLLLLCENLVKASNQIQTNQQTSNPQSSKSRQQLLQIYQSLISHNNKLIESNPLSVWQQHSITSTILPQLIQFYKYQPVQKIESQTGQMFRLLLTRFTHSSQQLQTINKTQQMSNSLNFNEKELLQHHIKQLIKESSEQWTKLHFLQITINYFLHQLNTTIHQYELLTTTQQATSIQKQQQQQLQQQQQTKLNLKIACLESIISTLTQTYSDFLTYIYHILQQWLQNDLKNNYYLSEQNKIYYLVHLLFLINWVQPHLLKVESFNSLPQTQKSLCLRTFVQRRSLHFTDNNFGKHFKRIFTFVNEEINKIASFFNKNQQGIQNRLLSKDQYQQKVHQTLTIITSNNFPANSKDSLYGSSIHEAFKKWYVVNQSTTTQTQPKSTNQSKVLNPQNNSNANNRFVSLTYKKLKQCVFQRITKEKLPNKSTTNCLLQQMLKLNKGQQSFLQQTFQFQSPTFNQQYLAFNYIYGDTKDIYFYQNHHYSHVLLVIYQTLINQHMTNLSSSLKQARNSQSKKSQQLLLQIFDHLRNYMGKYAKSHLVQANSKQFYEYLNLFKFIYITFTKQLLSIIPTDQLILTFDLILNEIIIKENHPLIRQYVEVIIARVYFTIKQRTFFNGNNQNDYSLIQKENSFKNNLQNQANNLKENIRKFNDCRTRMINMLDYDQDNLHNLNIGVPILMILGYELINYFQSQHSTASHLPIQSTLKQTNKSQESTSKHTKILHELDIHYVLVKYVACHVAYSRTICQYYMNKYLAMSKTHLNIKNDTLLQSLAQFWFADKDSINIMRNIALAVQGFKLQIDTFLKGHHSEEFQLGFERVEEYPQFESKYFLLRDTIQVFETLINSQNNQLGFDFKILFSQKLICLKQKALIMENNKIQLIAQSSNQKPKEQYQPKRNDRKKDRQVKDNKKAKQQQHNQKPTQQSLHNQVQQQSKTNQNTEDMTIRLNSKLQKQYNSYQCTTQPKVIIIATLLQKVHNFGYLVRTLTGHNAMLVVPTPQPFVHPQCKQLLPAQKQIDVKVIEIKPKQLQSFIKMYQHRGYPLIALQQCSKSIQLQKTVFPEKYMLLLGNERIGAPASLLSMADILVEIPQIGKVRSLNVHVSMVICFWEYLKQKDSKESPKEENNKKSIKGMIQQKKM